MESIEVILYVSFVKNEVNDPLRLKNSFGNLGMFLPGFNEEKSQKQIGGHVVSECKGD